MRALCLFLALISAAPAAAQQLPPDTARIYELTEVEVLPRPRNARVFNESLAKGYPPHLRAAGTGGTVQVEFIVGPDGWPVNVRVLSSPDSSFNMPTVRAVLLLQFTSAQVQGRPVFVRVEQPINWRVDSIGFGGCERKGEGEYELAEVEQLPVPTNRAHFQRVLAREYPLGDGDPPVAATVHVRFRVEVDGTASAQCVIRTTDSRFNEPSLRAISALRHRPAWVKGLPVKVWVEVPVQWAPPARR